jgi:hypothetical protein
MRIALSELSVQRKRRTGISVEVYLRSSEYPRPTNNANRDRGEELQHPA